MDPELKAMNDILAAVDGLDESTRERTLRWALAKFGLSGQAPAPAKKNMPGQLDPPDHSDTGEHATIAELFAAVDAPNGYTRALVAAYWLQVVQDKPDFTSFEVNKELKNLGHGSKRINNDFDDLMTQKPQLAVQLKKSGKAQQARKRYKITQAGIARVRELLGATE